jgi:hypothetical protein
MANISKGMTFKNGINPDTINGLDDRIAEIVAEALDDTDFYDKLQDYVTTEKYENNAAEFSDAVEDKILALEKRIDKLQEEVTQYKTDPLIDLRKRVSEFSLQ